MVSSANQIQSFKSNGDELTAYNCTVHFDSSDKYKEKIEDERISMKKYYHLKALSASEAIVAAESRGQSYIDFIQATKSIVLSSHASKLKSVINGNIKISNCMEAGVWE